MSQQRVIYEGSTTVLTVEVSALADLDDQAAVAFSLDGGATWETATWQGTAAKVRTASLTIDSDNAPTAPTDVTVLVKVGDEIVAASNRRVEFRKLAT